MTVEDKNFNIKNGLSVGTGKHQVLDSNARITANYFTLNAGGRYLSAGVDLWDLMSTQGIPPVSTNSWNSTYLSVLSNSSDWNSVYSWVNSDSATNNTDYNRTTFVNTSGDTISGDLEIEGEAYLKNHLRVDGHAYLSAAMYVENDVYVMGDLKADGHVYLATEGVYPKTVYVGATNDDNIVFVADVSSNFIPDSNITYDLGTSEQQWHELFVQDISASNDIFVDNDLLVSANGTIGTDFRVSGHTTVGGDTVLSGTLDVKQFTTLHDDLSVIGDMYVDGNVFLSGGQSGDIYLGTGNDDNVVFNADVNSNIIPESAITFDLGTDDKHWRNLFVHDVSASNDIRVQNTLYTDTIRTDDIGFLHIAAGSDDTAGSFIRLFNDNRLFLHADSFNFGDVFESTDNYAPWVMQIFTDTQHIQLNSTLTVVDDATFDSDVWIKGDLRVDGNAYLSAGVNGIINVGDTNTDNVVFHADIDSGLTPNRDVTFDLGTSTQQWRELFVQDISASNDIFVDNDLLVSANGTIGTDFRVSGHTTVGGDTVLSGTLDVEEFATFFDDVSVRGDLYVDGNAYLSAGADGNIYVGDVDTDNVIFRADINSSLIPQTHHTFNIGTDDKHWDTLYVRDVSASNDIRVNDTLFTDIIRTDKGNSLSLTSEPDETTNGSYIRLFNTTTGGGINLGANQYNFGDVFESTDSYRPWVMQIFTDTQHIKMDSTLNVVDDAIFDSDVWIKGDLRVDGNAYLSAGVNGVVYVGDTNTDNVVFRADVDSNIIPDDDVTYDLGTSTQQWRELFVQDISASNDIFVDNDLLVSANGTIGTDFRVSGHTTVGGDTVLSGTLTVDDAAYIYDTLDVELDTRLHSDLFVTNNTTISGNTVLSGALDVDGAANIHDTLDVELKTTLHSNLLVSGNTHIVGDLRVDGNAWLSAGVDGIINVGDTNTDNVVFRADIDSGLTPNKGITYDLGTSTQQWRELFVQDISATGDIFVDKNLSVSGDFAADGNTTLGGYVEIQDDLTVTGHVSAISGMSLTGDFTADDDVYIKGNIIVNGHAYFGFDSNSTNISLGNDDIDEIIFEADVGSDIIPYPTLTYSLGSSSRRWLSLYTYDVDVSNSVSARGDIVTRSAIIKTKVPGINQKIQTREDMWRGYNGGASTETIQVETFDSNEFQSAEYTVLLIRNDGSSTTIKIIAICDGDDINSTVYGNSNIGPTEPLVDLSTNILNDKIVLDITAMSWTKIMVSGKAMHLT